MRSGQNNWEFWTGLPEALHQITIVMSDRGIPTGFRNMHLFGSHTFSFINATNERFWVKFTFKPPQGINTLTDALADRKLTRLIFSHSCASRMSSSACTQYDSIATLNSALDTSRTCTLTQSPRPAFHHTMHT